MRKLTNIIFYKKHSIYVTSLASELRHQHRQWWFECLGPEQTGHKRTSFQEFDVLILFSPACYILLTMNVWYTWTKRNQCWRIPGKKNANLKVNLMRHTKRIQNPRSILHNRKIWIRAHNDPNTWRNYILTNRKHNQPKLKEQISHKA